jgi:hypothetical protein
MTVYFVQRVGDASHVKIGSAANVEKRMGELTPSFGAIELVGTMPGSAATERVLHRLFATSRREGEWFAADEALLEFIASDDVEKSGKVFEPRSRSWRNAQATSSQDADLSTASALLDKCFQSYPATMSIGAAIEAIFQDLSKANRAWTRRRIRSIREQKAGRIDLFEVVDLLTLAGIEVSEWGNWINSYRRAPA